METKRPDRSVGGEPVLVVATPSGFAKPYRFGEEAQLIAGRDGDVSMTIPDDSVSRRHAEFRREPLAVRDLGSTNGTRVHGESVGEIWVPLALGSLVEIGDAVVLARNASTPANEQLVPPKRTERRQGEIVDGLVGGAAMERVFSLVELVAPSKLGVLIVGETGAGKEVVAHALHRVSPRHDAPFLTLNCAAITATLLESELFGFEKGAFTGATAAKQGLLESARGGTVFLDEIGEMPLETQAKLLRVLESGEVLRIGALRPNIVDVRFVAATHRDLAALAEQQRFRLDLLFRIAGVTIEVPALRDRKDDIVPLATWFLRKLRPDGPMFSTAALDALRRHRWPGNVRELKAAVERAALLSRGGTIEVEHLAFGVGSALASTPAGDDERQRIVDALEACGGNQSRVAKQLGISRATLIRRIAALGIVRPRKH